MKDINKHISKALEPYKKESLYNLPIDLIAFPIIIIITLILFPIVLIEEIPLIILVLLANYRITILGMIEQKTDNNASGIWEQAEKDGCKDGFFHYAVEEYLIDPQNNYGYKICLFD